MASGSIPATEIYVENLIDLQDIEVEVVDLIIADIPN